MTTVLPGEIDLGSVQAAVGPAAWAAAHQLLAERTGGQVMWCPAETALQGYLQASDGFFETTIYLTPGRQLRFIESSCGCRRQTDCEHAAALTLAAAEVCGQDITARTPLPWERSLAALLPGGNDASPDPASRTPLAVEVSLRDVNAATRLSDGAARPPARLIVDARLVQPGRNGTWVAGQVAWGKLESLRYYGGYDPEHIRLLTELYSAYLSSHAGYYGSDQRYIDLAQFESRHLWPLLEEAAAVGLALIYPRRLGRLPACKAAELCLDVTRGARPGELVISPVIRVDGVPAVVPVRFVGSTGHGVVYADHADVERGANVSDWRFGLAALSRRASRELQDLALAGERLTVPPDEESKFRAEYCPRLRQAATLISSDESFTPPVISAPTLVLGASYGPGHCVDVTFEWLYQVGDSAQRMPLEAAAGARDPGYRDAAAERAILDGIAATPVQQYGLAAAGDDGQADGRLPLPGQEGTAIRPAAQLTGIDTMRFSTELLPLLSGQPGLALEITGEPADYREVTDALRIGVSADEIAGEHDWFDLGVTVTVDGQDVPFAALFVALSRGESHLLLDNGGYFSLAKPELQALARLIEEARTLADWPGSQLRISRFQADLWSELASLGLVERQAAAWQRQVDGLLSVSGGGMQQAELPAALTAQLRPYQMDGFQWLAFLWANRLGGILADDMGLGKTLQSLALICHARAAEPGAAPFLIVAPTSVVSNWASEAARFAPGLRVAVISETLARSGGDLASIAARADAVVTTYALLRIDSARYCALQWSGLILDEAQSVKNHQSRVYQCARRLPAQFKLAITGTPMENNLMELWSLLSITAPGLFPSPARFGEYYVRPIERRGQTELLARLRRRIKPLVKRRTKEQVAADCRTSRSRCWKLTCTRGTASCTRRTCSASGRRCWVSSVT